MAFKTLSASRSRRYYTLATLVNHKVANFITPIHSKINNKLVYANFLRSTRNEP